MTSANPKCRKTILSGVTGGIPEDTVDSNQGKFECF